MDANWGIFGSLLADTEDGNGFILRVEPSLKKNANEIY
jgi:hypothetical protein